MYQVIIADDEKKMFTVFENLIHWQELGLNLYKQVTNGDDLLSEASRASADIVITDMRMPGLCGAELLSKLRAYRPGISILVVSGFDDFDYMKQAIVSEAVDYIMKPVDEDELNQALKKAIEKQKQVQMQGVAAQQELEASEFAEYFRMIEDRQKTLSSTKNHQMALNIKNYLEEHYMEHISLQDLENLFYSNREYISRIFRNTFRVSVFDYLDHLKIQKANNMLKKGKDIKTIVSELGYYDESHFYKKYKKMMGILPSQYCG